MPNVCSICRNPNVTDINQALLEGGPLRTIADQFGVSKTSLLRHRDACLPAHLVKGRDAHEVLNASNLVAHLQGLREATMAILAEAKKCGDSAMMLRAIQRAEGQLRLAAEMLGQLRSQVDLNVRVIRSAADLRDEELQALMREGETLMRTLPPEERAMLLAPPSGSQ